MHLHPDDPRLTALLLDELPADEAAALHQALAQDPALRTAQDEMESLRNDLTQSLTPETLSLWPHQRQAIRDAARHSATAANLAAHIRHNPWHPWLAALAAAAAIILAFLLFAPSSGLRKQGSPSQTAAVARDHPPALLEPPQPAEATRPADLLAERSAPSSHGNRPVAPADCPMLALPVQAGHAGWASLRACLRTERQLPPASAVRLEEILNSFDLHPNGLTVVARQPESHWHPDDRESGATTHAATLATETLACPWKPSASLVLISMRGNPFSDSHVQAVLRPNPATVHHVRLLGFAPVPGLPESPTPTCLPAKSSTLLVLEIEPSSTSGDLGTIEWSVNEQRAATLTLTRHGDAEPSDDARFASLVCTFAQWLTGDPSAGVDRDLLAALARETTSETQPDDQADFLKLIAEALSL